MMLDLLGDRPVDGDAVALAKVVLDELPETSLGHFDGAGVHRSLKQGNHQDVHGEQIADRFLHPMDRPYSAREMFDFVDRAGLAFAGFQSPREAMLYDPLNVVRSPAILAALQGRRFRDRAEFAERWHCRLNMHRVYLTKRPGSLVSARDRVLTWQAPHAAGRFGMAGAAHMTVHGVPVPVRFSEPSVALLSAADGATPNGDLIDRLGLDERALAADEHNLRNGLLLTLIDIRPAGT